MTSGFDRPLVLDGADGDGVIRSSRTATGIGMALVRGSLLDARLTQDVFRDGCGRHRRKFMQPTSR